MVKKGKNKFTEIEKKLIVESDDEEFVSANNFIANEVENEEEENYDDGFYQAKDEQLIDKLKSIDGKKRKRLRTEVVNDELDVNISN